MRLVEFALVSCFLHHQRLLDVLCLSPCVVLFPLTWLYCLIKLWRINNFKSHLSIHHLQNKYRCLLITFPTYLNSYSPNCIRIFPFYHTHAHTHTHTQTHIMQSSESLHTRHVAHRKPWTSIVLLLWWASLFSCASLRCDSWGFMCEGHVYVFQHTLFVLNVRTYVLQKEARCAAETTLQSRGRLTSDALK